MNAVMQPKKKENGQSMIELALTITILMVLLAGTIDLGRAFFTWLTMRDASQEGATYGSYDPAISVQNIKDYVVSLITTDVIKDPGALITVNVTFTDPNKRCLGYDPAEPSLNKPNSITVEVVYQNFPITMPFLGTILGSQTIPIHATINDTIIKPVCP